MTMTKDARGREAKKEDTETTKGKTSLLGQGHGEGLGGGT